MIGSDAERDREVVEAVTREVVHWKREARECARTGDVEAELAAWRKVLELDGEDPLARPVLARLLVRCGRFEEATPLLWTLAEADPDDTETWRLLVKTAVLKGDVDGQITVWTRMLALRGPELTLLARLVRLLMSVGRTTEAVPHLIALIDPTLATPSSGRTLGGNSNNLVQLFTATPLAEFAPEVRAACAACEDEAGAILAALLGEMEPARLALLALKQRLVDGAAGEDAVSASAPFIAAMKGLAPADLTTRLGRLQTLIRVQLWTELANMLTDHHATLAQVNALEAWIQSGGAASWAHRRLARLLARCGRQDEAKHIAEERAAEGGPAHRRERLPADPLHAILPRHLFVLPHAPKTGGSSVKSGLVQLLGCASLTGAHLTSVHAALAQTSADARLSLAVLSGHFTADQAEDELIPLVGLEPLFLAVVRDPAARMKSIYSYIGRRGSAEQRDRQLRTGFDPDVNVVVRRWLDAPSDWGGWRHDQCRMICGEPNADAAIRALETRFLAAVVTTSVNDMVAAVAAALGRPAPRPAHRKQTNSQDLQLDPGLEARIRCRDDQDRKLFDWVQANQARLLERCTTRLGELQAG